MKQLHIYLFMILIGFTSCQTNPNEVIIRGKISGDIPKEIKCSVPVNKICYGFFQVINKVDSLGNFEFKFNVNEPCFIDFFNIKHGELIIEPNESYNIKIDSKNGKKQLQVKCRNQALLEVYQKLISPEHPQFEAMKIWNLPIAIATNKIDSMYEKEINSFERLLDKGNVSTKLFDLIEFDRKMYYSCIKQQVATYKYINSKRHGLTANTDNINKMWNEAVSNIPLDSPNFLKSKWAYYYLENYLLYQEYTAKDFKPDARSKAREQGNIHTYLLGVAKKYLDSDRLEFYTSSYILSKAWQNKFEKELINLFDEFKIGFPNSKYSKYLESRIERITAFHKKAEQKFDKEIHFLDNYENLNSLDECLKQFKGKKVYIDIWATSCGPCKKEFKYNDKLKETLKNKGVEILYISLDGDRYKRRWEDMIKYYDLTGNHLRANTKLKADLDNKIGYSGIPHYCLIDENGDILIKNAKRPSKINELEKQLNRK